MIRQMPRIRWHDLPEPPPERERPRRPALRGAAGWPWTLHCRPLPRCMEDGAVWPSIGIVVPSFNQADFIEQTLRSIVLQNYPHLRCTVEDGDSTDGTMAILERYRERLSHFRHAPDDGQADAINQGITRLAGCEWVGWLNSDDFLLPGALEHIGRAAAAAPSTTVAIVGRGYHVKGPRRMEASVPPAVLDRETIANWRRGHFLQPCCFFRREAFERAGGLDTSLHYALDFDLWLRLSCQGDFLVIDAPIAADHHHPSAKTQRDPGLYFAEAIEVLFRHGEREAARDMICDMHAEYLYLASIVRVMTSNPLYRRLLQPTVQRLLQAPPSLRRRLPR